jgi:uncharacterized phage-like protein YoqJ
VKSDLQKCCAFTGHRPKKFPWKYDEKDKRCIALKAVLTEQIAKLAEAGVTDFYTGMALGVDTWAAMAVLDLRGRNPAVKLHCVLPCEGQEDTWTIPAQVRYKYILGEADSVKYVKRLYDGKCMLERNQRLVDSAGIMIAVYNGEKRGGCYCPLRTKGGSGDHLHQPRNPVDVQMGANAGNKGMMEEWT